MMTLADSKNMMLVLLIMLICAIVMFIAVIANHKHSVKYEEMHPLACIVVALCSFTFVITLFFLPQAAKADIAKFNKNTYEKALNSGYTVYVDGTLVDTEKIDINHYKITIDEEKCEVYLSPKN